MALLSSPLTTIEPHYDVIVIGSGYGGSVSACRLARAIKADGTPVRVCLLERGREIPVGRFPDKFRDLPSVAQVEGGVGPVEGDLGGRDSLFWVRVGAEISIVAGCGLGGTSLINASVSLEPDKRVWDEHWPDALLADVDGGIAAGFRRAKDMLKPVDYPESYPPLDKYAALGRAAASIEAKVEKSPINVNFEAGANHVGVHQDACNGCGDCTTGCNIGAKNTLAMNYLPDARRSGASIFCGVDVRYVCKDKGQWRVHYQPIGWRRELYDAPPLFVRANVVIVAAGSAGTSEIMLRSHVQQGLPCSNLLGQKFTGNGDLVGFGYNCDYPVNGVGRGARKVSKKKPPGPTITGMVDLRGGELADGIVIEEGVIPGALASILPAAMSAAAAALGKDTDRGVKDKLTEWWREAKSWGGLCRGAFRGAVRNTITYLSIGHDDSFGTFSLDSDKDAVLELGWKKGTDGADPGQQPVFKHISETLEGLTTGLGGTYVPSPLFNKVFGYGLITVHPLGGCSMGEDAKTGVVDHKGRVFAGQSGTDIHEGLYVNDGAIMPRSIGVNPLLTISAIAERNVAILADDRSWRIKDELHVGKSERDGTPDKVERLSIQFSERMAGYFSEQILEDFEDALEHGKSEDKALSFVVSIVGADMDRLVENPDHEAELLGTVDARFLSPRPLVTSGGRFNIFVEDGADGRTKTMRYRMRLSSVDNDNYYLEGFKTLRDDPGFDSLSDATTLFTTVYEGHDATGTVRAKGVLRVVDFDKHLRTVMVVDQQGNESGRGLLRFARFFVGELWDTYGPGLR